MQAVHGGAKLVWCKSITATMLNIMVATGDGQHAVRIITAATAATKTAKFVGVPATAAESMQASNPISKMVADHRARTPLHIAGCVGDGP
jgi:hypothetical protein